MSEALGISLDGYKQIERGRNVWIDFWRCLIHLKCTRRGAACIKDITGEYIMDKKFEIGNKIREIRIKKNVSVLELSYRSNISTAHIYKIENGHDGISIDTLCKIADSLGTDANTILGLEKETVPLMDKLNELDPEMKQKFEALFCAMLDQAGNGLAVN